MYIKVLFEGEHVGRMISDGKYLIYPHTSSATLISDGKTHVLVDTGAIIYKDKLLETLKLEGLTPDDITHVLLTHFHKDHSSNWLLFKTARVHVSDGYSENQDGKTYLSFNGFPDMPLGIQAARTPGHTEDHVSYFIEIKGIRYCCAGDAVREDIVRQGIPSYLSDHAQINYRKSLKYIFENSDVIIPGHHGLIQGDTKNELDVIVEAL